jgi:hypothetical protein
MQYSIVLLAGAVAMVSAQIPSSYVFSQAQLSFFLGLETVTNSMIASQPAEYVNIHAPHCAHVVITYTNVFVNSKLASPT